MAWPQVLQVQIHFMLPDPVSADTGVMLGLALQTRWLVVPPRARQLSTFISDVMKCGVMGCRCKLEFKHQRISCKTSPKGLCAHELHGRPHPDLPSPSVLHEPHGTIDI